MYVHKLMANVAFDCQRLSAILVSAILLSSTID